MNTKYAVSAAALVCTATAFGSVMERDRGIHIGERMTLRPYVTMSYVYDSNVDSGRHSKAGSQWSVNPGLTLDCLGENWKLDAKLFYRYHAYNRYTSQLNQSSYGESLNFSWADSESGEPGWTVSFGETFEQIAQDDDMSGRNGRGLGRDRKMFRANGAVERRVNEYLHMGVSGNYYLLDYDNNVEKYMPLYGWKTASVGADAGYVHSRWLDLIVSGDYQWYWQDNDRDLGSRSASRRGRHVSSDSKGYTLLAGVGSRAGDKLTYRLMTGWSHFEYGSGTKDCDGWVYRVNASWQTDAENTLRLMAVGSSYYQPGEREYGSALKVYTASFGLAKSIVRCNLSATADLAYRKETHEYVEYKQDDYDEDIWTARVGLNYRLYRFFSIFGRIEYQTEMCTGGSIRGNAYDYDRWRGTVGVTLDY